LELSISKEFIESQGGEIKVESEIGEGSKFSFSLNI
jgi:signal transduction histidine kinase